MWTTLARNCTRRGADGMDSMCHSGPHAAPWSAWQGESLLDVLKRRYALGEITREQFEEIKRTLGVSDASSANERANL